jgi:hypothetical protein
LKGLPFEVHEGILARIERQMHEPSSWRDMMTIRRTAKDGWIEKRMNAHFLTPDGHQHEILLFSHRATKSIKELRATGSNDLFFFCFFEDGKRIDNQVTKAAWYALRDKQIVRARGGGSHPSVVRASEYGERLADLVLRREAATSASSEPTAPLSQTQSDAGIEKDHHSQRANDPVQFPSDAIAAAPVRELWANVSGFIDAPGDMQWQVVAKYAVLNMCKSAKWCGVVIAPKDFLPSPLNVGSALSASTVSKMETSLRDLSEAHHASEGTGQHAVGADLARVFLSCSKFTLTGHGDLQDIFVDAEKLIRKAATSIVVDGLTNGGPPPLLRGSMGTEASLEKLEPPVADAKQADLNVKQTPLHPKTVAALKSTGMTEAKYREADDARNAD